MKSLSHYKKVLAWSLKHYQTEHDVEIDTENGLLSVSNKDWLMGKHLFVHRNYEINFIENTIAFLRKEGWLKAGTNNIVLDIGANIGMIGIALLRKKFFEKSWEFEPSPNSFRLLEKNVKQNNLEEKIRCFNIALSSENDLFEFELAEGNSGDNRVKLTSEKGKRNEQKRKTIQITANTFDDFLLENSEFNSSEIDLIWMDIQGHEGHFFKGAEHFLKKRKVACVSEFWGYGIKRAGMTQNEYCAILKTIFTHFYLYDGKHFQLLEIDEIKSLFRENENPRHIESVIFVNKD